MKPGRNFIERALSDSINCAVNQAVKNPSGSDPFGSALKSSMDWYALTLPAALQHDRVTNKETIPSKRQVTVNSYNNQNAKPKHRLIKEVKGGKIVFNQPLVYTVKTGDTLSEIAWKHTGRRASVQNLKNWNTIFSDTIRPGQVLKLADPDDKLIKEAIAKLSKSELSSRNPSINLDTLSREMVIQHGDLLDSEYQVLIKLEYNEPWQNFLNPELFEQPEQGVPWAPGYSGNYGMGNSFDDQQVYPDEIGQEGGDLSDWISGVMWTTNTAVGALSTYTVVSGKYYKWNEIWHHFKNKPTSYFWQNRFKHLKGVRTIQTNKVASARSLAGKLTKAGGVLIVADIALSGEVKPSHAINAAMLGISTTGVGAIVAGAWFIADFGTMGVSYIINGEVKGIGDMLDNSFGTVELYDGLY